MGKGTVVADAEASAEADKEAAKNAGKKAAKKAAKKAGKKAGRPKAKCCVSKDRCDRCPIRMLKDGTLPAGYTVKKRKLVKVKKVQKKQPLAA